MKDYTVNWYVIFSLSVLEISVKIYGLLKCVMVYKEGAD